MAFSSLFTLIDDIASLLDDVALMTKMAAKKTVGVVGDDLALNANQVTGASAERELPIVWAVMKGSFVNKLILIPLALLLSAFLPGLIVPLLMLGGAYLCFEGVEKLLHKFFHHDEPQEKNEFNEQVKIKGAIRTDFILSAEIIIIALGELTQADLITRIITLSIIGIGITVLVYGLVALIVKTDDFGLFLMKKGKTAKSIGQGILLIMPKFMRALSVIGTLAMFLVGGGIFVHHLDFIHHFLEQYQLTDGWISNLAALIVGVVIGAIICAIVLPIMKLVSKH
ncbi:DUF808 domain-containing protein [Rodentibacter trehalosifermentans]|uniref:DUF808 domain-containing protein n=1 Tax=Rodentibacter trehalosifermentans TaxID=1908263 RepID=A0A1V3IYA7_9PAST|nr:DUF808 domain-containing protein [Rodentibacter trehalosifermentans]OOF47349.1 hypothetical protein BKK51_00405 [Rodentibacter trehalosifermentans]OOF49066.1 hypothetical protein BKK52_04545 [Rodentibacter trehalosifermentans]OOF52877.1 hypothetical protein BKK53_03485 [Rodentibacter trehalosifermentans]